MLSSESQIGEMFRAAMRDRYGDADPLRFRAAIRSAVRRRIARRRGRAPRRTPLDLMIVIGKLQLNACNLARMCDRVRHTTSQRRRLVSATEIRHKPVGGKEERISAGWLPGRGSVRIGLTSGASTPDNLVDTVVRRLDELANQV